MRLRQKFGQCFLYLFSCFIVSLCQKRGKMEVRVVGGQTTGIERFPWSAQFLNSGSICAGSILNTWTILTAAHCLTVNLDINDMVVQTGARYLYDTKATMYDVNYFVIHPDYNREMPFSCDAAVVFVIGPIELSRKVKKAVLVSTNKWMRDGETLAVNGWGQIKYNGPVSDVGQQWTNLSYVPKSRCQRWHNLTMTKDMFCLYGHGRHDTCKGDSGGGVDWKGYLAGIVSHGAGCADKKSPSVYTNILVVKEWIKSVITQFISNCNDNALRCSLKSL